jgi:putative membrane protein|tara:strand:- start:818 stop:1837 length:1020 start_codon:yes stop_codon:yes gene_type:complete
MNPGTYKRSPLDIILLIVKGITMGAANKVPGVSGGIVALVGGFYEELIFSFQRLNVRALKLFFTGRLKSFWTYINGQFLSYLFSGVIISYFSVSLLLDFAIKQNEAAVLGAFFGMIIASLILIVKQIKKWSKNILFLLVLGLLIGISLNLARPASEDDHLLFVFFCGIISVSGMTIPGLSGSFLLLILGNYNLLLVDTVNALFSVLSNAILLNFETINDPTVQHLLLIMSVFTLGSIMGLILFSNLIKWILKTQPQLTLATIIGFIAGTLSLVWPWKIEVYKYDTEGILILNSVGNPKLADYHYYLPDFGVLDTYGVILSILLGASLLFAIDYYDKKRK